MIQRRIERIQEGKERPVREEMVPNSDHGLRKLSPFGLW